MWQLLEQKSKKYFCSIYTVARQWSINFQKIPKGLQPHEKMFESNESTHKFLMPLAIPFKILKYISFP